MAEPALQRGPPLDLAHHGGVVTDPGVEAEVAAVHLAQPDRFGLAGGDPGGELLHRGHGIVGHAEGAGEHVRAATGQYPECGVRAGHARGHLVEGAVATEPDHHVEPPPGGVLGEARGVATTVGLDDFHLVAPVAAVGGEGAVHHHGVAGRHRRREGVHHEQDSQGDER
jgi:hypothetical protein